MTVGSFEDQEAASRGRRLWRALTAERHLTAPWPRLHAALHAERSFGETTLAFTAALLGVDRGTRTSEEILEDVIGRLAVGVVATAVEFEEEGFRIGWGGLRREGRYVGEFVTWADVRDFDPGSAPPEIRFRDGRTIFISAMLCDDLEAAATSAGIPSVRRPDAWGLILSPFLDTSCDDPSARDAPLWEWGFTRREVTLIRSRYAARMMALTFLTWEWCHYGQTDVISVAFPWGRWSCLKAMRYRRFRRWTDEIADRPMWTLAKAADSPKPF